jgi:hypothetical protein
MTTSLSVSSYFSQLAGLSLDPPSLRSVTLGGQNFTHCCLIALNQSLVVQDGNLTYASPSFVDSDVSIESLKFAAQNNEFPCGTSFTGDVRGAPVISGT